MKYQVCLTRDSVGVTRIVAGKENRREVYRIKMGDSLVFSAIYLSEKKWTHSVAVRDITDTVVVLLEVEESPTNVITAYGSTREWAPALPGPYSFELVEGWKGVYSERSHGDFFSVESSVVVSPNLRRPPFVGLHSLRMLTLLPRRLGPISGWHKWISAVVSSQGYNAIHFTPFQPSGPSHSAYSIADVLDVDPELWGLGEPMPADRWSAFVDDVLVPLKKDSLFLVTDVVFNHASSVNSWAVACPSATYCLRDCGYLRGAFDIDQMLKAFSQNNREKYAVIKEQWQMDQLVRELRHELEKFNLGEYFELDFSASVRLWLDGGPVGGAVEAVSGTSPWEQAIAQIGVARGKKIIVDCRNFCASEAAVWAELHALERRLAELAGSVFSDILAACESTVRYERIEKGQIAGDLIPSYFAPLSNGDFALNNGWVMNWPAGVDFADPGHHLVYMRRHVVVWSDCLKLRYGPPEKDSPLWRTMLDYCGRIAANFDGVRLDNCHSTPVFVLRRLIAHMRTINPDIVIIAELFTGEANNDDLYECTLGIDLLVREAMQIHSLEDLAWKLRDVNMRRGNYGMHESATLSALTPSPPTYLLYDSTHDNGSVQTKFGSFRDSLPLSAMAFLGAASAAVGSSVGYDALSVRMPSVVQPVVRLCLGDFGLWTEEKRRSIGAIKVYGDWDDWKKGVVWQDGDLRTQPFKGQCNEALLVPSVSQLKFFLESEKRWTVSPAMGTVLDRAGNVNNLWGSVGSFAQIKRMLNGLRDSLEGFDETEVNCVGGGIIEVRRLNPRSMEQVVLLVRFGAFGENSTARVRISLAYVFSKLEFALSLEHAVECCENPLYATRHPASVRHWSTEQLGFLIEKDGREVSFAHVPESGALLIRSRAGRGDAPLACCPIEGSSGSPLLNTCSLTPLQFSSLLFRCDAEEPAYEVPGRGKLIFAGLAGLAVELEDNSASFLNSALAQNVRQGDWLFDYTVDRLQRGDIALSELHAVFTQKIRPWYSGLPDALKPRFLVSLFYHQLFRPIVCQWEKEYCPDEASSFERKLMLATFQFTAETPFSVAAGLPFFATGYMRCWGRDTFMAFPGMFCGNFFASADRRAEGRAVILQFAAVVRHGLIPNLFDNGNNPRYNSRDAVWCFLRAVVAYLTEDEKEGESIGVLEEPVELKYYYAAFPWSTSESARTLSLKQIVRSLLLSHYEGISFQEWNCGPSIDEHMRPEGFQVDCFVEKSTGLVYGGNPWNCGTWMDKMGSASGNKGVPATPRHGAAVEINGLALCALDYFVPKHFQDDCSLVAWRNNLTHHFDLMFYSIERGMYWDVIGGDVVEINRLRPNACFALSVIPKNAVNTEHACSYLRICEESLLGPLGMRTLPATDIDYNGVYDNSDSTNGYNYHNGPEWVWLIGHYLIACTKFNVFPKRELIAVLKQHEQHIASDP